LGLADQLSILGRADLNALVIGSPTEEGGDIVVYKDTAGGIAFQLDSDAVEIGIATAPVSNNLIKAVMKATDRFGIYIDGLTNKYTGELANYACYIARHISTGVSSTGFTSRGLTFGAINYRDFEDALWETMETEGIRGVAVDYGAFIEVVLTAESERDVVGFPILAQYQGKDSTTVNNLVDVRGLSVETKGLPEIDKTAGLLTLKNYGIYSKQTTDPTITAGNFEAYTYGAYIEALGTTEGIQTVYGVYAKAGGGDKNWAGYFVGADVYIEHGLEIDGVLDINGSPIDVDDIDIPASSVSGLSAVIPVKVAGVTKYIPVYDSYA